jgi:hypothetical protein
MLRIGSLVLVVLVLVGGAAAFAQDAPSRIRLTHVVPDAPTATLLVDGAEVMLSPVGTAGDGYVEVAPGTPTIEVEVDGVRALAEPRELRSGFRYVAVVYETTDGLLAVLIAPGPTSQPIGGALARVVNVVESIERVQVFGGATCDGIYRFQSGATGTVAPWYFWEDGHHGNSVITVCSEGRPLVPTRQRPEAGPWPLMGHAVAFYVVPGSDGPEVLLVDEWP